MDTGQRAHIQKSQQQLLSRPENVRKKMQQQEGLPFLLEDVIVAALTLH